MSTPGKDRPEGISRLWDDLVVSPYREFLNFVGDTGRWLGSRPLHEDGQGIGDTHPVIGTTNPNAAAVARSNAASQKRYEGQANAHLARVAKQAQNNAAPNDQGGGGGGGGGMDFQSALAQALQFMSQMQANQTPYSPISYDPLRQDAQARSSEYDARLEAMYSQLMDSIRADAAGIQQNFQSAIDNSAARSAQTQAAIQGAHDGAQSRNIQQAQALGIEEAMGNILGRNKNVNNQAASRVSDSASRGQIQGDLLESNRATSLAHNTNLVGAAGLEGNLQRARIGNELASLLAQYDMQEQSDNREGQYRHQQMQQGNFNQALGFAEMLLGDQRYRQEYDDSLQQRLFENELAQQQLIQQGMQPHSLDLAHNYITQQMQGQFGEMTPEEQAKWLSAFASLTKSL